MPDSQQLLADYAGNSSEDAFRELVTRYLALVYSTAIRMVGGDTHLAEDVAQMVFVDLARKARALPPDVMLGGWLHRNTCFVAAKMLRGERRRQSRERQSVEMSALQNDSETAQAQVAPILDDAINQLGAEDRTAILLRYFEQRDFRAVGAALGSTEDAARMRINRALEKLESLLKHRGVTVSATALGVALTAEAVTMAPAGLALTVSSTALAGAAAGSGATLGLLKIMTMTKATFTLGALVIVGAMTALVVQHQAQLKLRADNDQLQQRVSELTADNDRLLKHPHILRLPVPSKNVAMQPAATVNDTLTGTNIYARLLTNTPKLTAGQVDRYLDANGRKASSLLAAYRTSGDKALLKEAMEKYPNDPQVAFEAAISRTLSGDEQRQWLNNFEQAAPNNALANYLSAQNYFASGDTAQALQELTAAAGKPQFQDYTLNRAEDDNEAYLSAGYSVAEAEGASTMSLELPQLADVKNLGRDLIALANNYTQAGDASSAQAALQTAITVGQNLVGDSTNPTLISQLTGMAIERMALGDMDPNSAWGDTGQTVQDEINQLAQARANIAQLAQQTEGLMQNFTDQDLINYNDRRNLFGEVAAMQWLVGKYGPH